MSRVEEFKNVIKEAVKKGGMSREEWILCFLQDIALSLARIVDVLEGKGE